VRGVPITYTEVVIPVVAVFAGIILFQSDHAFAEAEDHGFDYGEIDSLFEDPLEKDGHIDFGPLDPFFDSYFQTKDEFGQRTGINYLIEDRLINQWGDGASIYDNELNLIARWDFIENTTLGSSSINVWGQFAQSIGDTASEFQADLGVLSPLNGGNGGPDKTNEILQMLAWEQILPGEKARFQVGKLSTRTLVNLNRYAHGDSESFFTPMLGNNPVVPYTALLGLGVFGQWKEKGWYVSGLVRAADTEKGISSDAIEDGDFAYIGEIALTPTIEGLGYGEYRLTLSYDEETDTRPDVFTVSASLDQDFGERYGGFFRFAHGEDTFRAFENRVAAGFQLKKPFDFSFDRFGVGAWWGDPAASALDDELGLEIFYKAQVKRFVEITPNFQLVHDPALSNDDIEAVAGLRLRVAF
jgi:porin